MSQVKITKATRALGLLVQEMLHAVSQLPISRTRNNLLYAYLSVLFM